MRTLEIRFFELFKLYIFFIPMAAAAWSQVEKILHEHHLTSAPNTSKVSIKTAVYIVICKDPVIRAPNKGF